MSVCFISSVSKTRTSSSQTSLKPVKKEGVRPLDSHSSGVRRMRVIVVLYVTLTVWVARVI